MQIAIISFSLLQFIDTAHVKRRDAQEQTGKI